MIKNIIIIALSICLLFCICHFYRLRPYERHLQEREKKIQDVIEEYKKNYIRFDGLFLIGQPTQYLEAGQPEIALRWAELAIAYQVASTSYLDRAEAYYCLGEYQNALKSYEEALSRFSIEEYDYFKVPLGLAKSHYQMGHKQEAAEYFVKAILRGFDEGNLKDSKKLINELFVPLYLEKSYEKEKITRQDIINLLESEKGNSNEKEKYERTIELLVPVIVLDWVPVQSVSPDQKTPDSASNFGEKPNDEGSAAKESN
jgi:tetratricopeptide (TPR) repeat protein